MSIPYCRRSIASLALHRSVLVSLPISGRSVGGEGGPYRIVDHPLDGHQYPQAASHGELARE